MATFKTLALDERIRLNAFTSGAYEDYIAARILFNNDSLQSATLLANTCIEKELKARLILLGEKSKKIHNTVALWDCLNKIDNVAAASINRKFLNLLSIVYKSRYTAELEVGYYYIIFKLKTLAELDFVYNFLVTDRESNLGIKSEDNQTPYRHDIQGKKKSVFENNYLLNGSSKKLLLQSIRDDFIRFKIEEFAGGSIMDLSMMGSVGEGVSSEIEWNKDIVTKSYRP